MDATEAALYAEDGPVAAASAFVHAVRRMNVDLAWRLVHPEAQLADAQFWARDTNRPWDDANLVVELGAGSPLWRQYAREHLSTYLDTLSPFFDLVDWDELGTVSGHRPVGLDLEDVWFTAGRSTRTFQAPESVTVLRLLMMRHPQNHGV